jgi:GT2 family glycosyltransferase
MTGVVIPCAVRTPALCEALHSVSGTPVIVVDASTAQDLQLEGVSVVHSGGKAGFSAAANLGLAEMESRGIERVFVLNDDAVLHPGALSALEEAWVVTDGAVAPVLHEPDGPVYGIRVGPFGRVTLARTCGPVEALSGAAIMLRASERFDPAYVHGFEDVELCHRLRQRGLKIRCVQTAHCDHAAGATISRRSREAQRHGLSGHLRYLRGGVRGVFAVLLALLQVIREGGPLDRFQGIGEGIVDYLRADPPTPPLPPVVAQR